MEFQDLADEFVVPDNPSQNGNILKLNDEQEESSGDDAVSSALELAQAEWAAVATVPIVKIGNTECIAKLAATPLIDVSTAIDHFRQHVKLSSYKANIKPTLPVSGLRACLKMLFGPPNIYSDLVDDRDLLFAMAAWPFDNDDSCHIQMLQTVYKRLTGSKLDVPRFGNHWDDIGFQGSDPATDLRGVGCLGLVNALYMVSNPRLTTLAKDIYKLSCHAVQFSPVNSCSEGQQLMMVYQNFPFCVMSLNMTRITLQALRAEAMNKEINRRRDVISVFHEVYAAAFLHLYVKWKEEKKTIADSGFVLKDVEAFCKKSIVKAVQSLESHLHDSAAGESTVAMMEFSKMEDLEEDN